MLSYKPPQSLMLINISGFLFSEPPSVSLTRPFSIPRNMVLFCGFLPWLVLFSLLRVWKRKDESSYLLFLLVSFLLPLLPTLLAEYLFHLCSRSTCYYYCNKAFIILHENYLFISPLLVYKLLRPLGKDPFLVPVGCSWTPC